MESRPYYMHGVHIQSRGACSVSVGYKKKSAIRFSPVFGSPEVILLVHTAVCVVH